MKKKYLTPELDCVELYSASVLCNSVKEDNGIDPLEEIDWDFGWNDNVNFLSALS